MGIIEIIMNQNSMYGPVYFSVSCTHCDAENVKTDILQTDNNGKILCPSCGEPL